LINKCGPISPRKGVEDSNTPVPAAGKVRERLETKKDLLSQLYGVQNVLEFSIILSLGGKGVPGKNEVLCRNGLVMDIILGREGVSEAETI